MFFIRFFSFCHPKQLTFGNSSVCVVYVYFNKKIHTHTPLQWALNSWCSNVRCFIIISRFQIYRKALHKDVNLHRRRQIVVYVLCLPFCCSRCWFFRVKIQLVREQCERTAINKIDAGGGNKNREQWIEKIGGDAHLKNYEHCWSNVINS